MEANSPKNKVENPTENSSKEPALYNAAKLINISIQAKILAWCILGLSIIYFIVSIINIFSDYNRFGYSFSFKDFDFYLLAISPAFIGLFLYIILRFIAESVSFFMDIEIDIRESKERQG